MAQPVPTAACIFFIRQALTAGLTRDPKIALKWYTDTKAQALTTDEATVKFKAWLPSQH
jgi:hypothetical protein